MRPPVSATTLEQGLDVNDSTPLRFAPPDAAPGPQQDDLVRGWRSLGHRSAPGAPPTAEGIHRGPGTGFRMVADSAGRSASARVRAEHREYGSVVRYLAPAAMAGHGNTSWYAPNDRRPDSRNVPDIHLPRSYREVADALRSVGAEKEATTTSLLRVVLPDPSRPKDPGMAWVYSRAQTICDGIGAERASGPLSTISDKDDAQFPARLDRHGFSFQIISHMPLWEIRNAATHDGIIGALRRAGMPGVAERLTYLRSVAAGDPEEPAISLDSLREFAQFLVSERELPRPRVSVSPDGLVHAEWRLRSKGLLAMQFKPAGDIRFSAISRPWQDGIRREVLHGTRPKKKTLETLHDFMSQISDH